MSNIGPINGDYHSKKYIRTEDGSVYEKVGWDRTAGAVIVGNTIGGLTLRPIQNVFRKPVLSAIKDMEQLYQANNSSNKYIGTILGNKELSTAAKEFGDASKTAFAKSGLKAKGVKIIDVKELSDFGSLDKFVHKQIRKFPKLKKFLEERIIKPHLSKIAEGKNACFIPNANKIYINTEKMSYTSFHEMGHALNANMGKVGKILMKARTPGRLLTSAALLIGIFKRKKVEGEKPQGAIDKVTTFIKDNCGKLAFLGFLPTILEEGLASIKGAKLAKGLLSEGNYKLLNRFNSKAWLTYLGAAIATAVATTFASKVRDWISEPKKVA